jgi:flagellar hook-associated protein 2
MSGTTLSRGQNAQFTVNGGGTLESASNTLDSSVHGIDGLSVAVSSASTQSISVAADTSGMKSKIQDFVDAFNEVQQYLETVTKISTDSKGKVTSAALSGNREIQEWGRNLRSMAFAAITGGSDGISRLTDMGLDFKTGTDELEIADDAKLTSVLANSTAGLEAFFSTSTTGFAAKFDTYLESITEQNSDQQERLNKYNESLSEQIATIERRLQQQREIMESAFISMETAQSKLKQQATAVSNMFQKSSS